MECDRRLYSTWKRTQDTSDSSANFSKPVTILFALPKTYLQVLYDSIKTKTQELSSRENCFDEGRLNNITR